jgi:uncharacterized membrane protein
MARIVLNAALAAVIGLSAVGTAAAQANHNTARSNKSTVAAPSGGEDQKTAAHEAAHVVQQRGGGAGVGKAHEHHGDHAAPVGARNEVKARKTSGGKR